MDLSEPNIAAFEFAAVFEGDFAAGVPEETGEIRTLLLVERGGGAEEKIVVGEVEVRLGGVLQIEGEVEEILGSRECRKSRERRFSWR